MNRNILSLGEYIAWIYGKYRELQKEAESNEKYRLLDVVYTTYETCELKVQIIGTDKIVYWSPQKVAADDNLIEGFSKKDIRAISYFACKEIKKPKYKITSHGFSEKLNKIVFLIKKIGSKESIEKTAAEISANKNMIKAMYPSDAHRVGFLQGCDETDEEKNLIKEICENSQ